MRKYADLMGVSRIYTFVWNKYRPAILNLMTASAGGPQQYKLTDHEFRCLNPKEKGGYAFTLQVFKGKAVNNIKESQPAQDLLAILRRSSRALLLAEAATYEFTLDRKFMLHVTRHETVLAPENTLTLPNAVS